jgi:glycosyltransferase involved in cell wall biosynthesis
MDPKIVIVSPVRNEARHLERVVRSVAAQSLLPARMVVIDDRSTDGTFEILQALAAELPFLVVTQAPARVGGRDRLARAIEAQNFNAALDLVDLDEFTHVMKLDGDIELPPDYLESVIARFDADPGLGLAGGVLMEPTSDAGLREIIIPRHHVHGALKLYSRACFQSIGGIQERLGWDTIDETYARMGGFATRSYRDIVAIHHRPVATADGALRGRARHGECAWILHYSLLWVLLRSLKISLVYRPRGLAGVAFLYGYIRASVRGVERVPDPEFRRFTRNELRQRLRRPGRASLGLSPSSIRVAQDQP